jgi:ribosome biogenesis protein Nip4
MEKETKQERFLRLAEIRINNALNEIRKIGNLSNTSLYEYTDNDISEIFKELNRTLAESKSKFNNRSSSNFTLRK